MELKITYKNAMNKISAVESADGRFTWNELSPEDLRDIETKSTINGVKYIYAEKTGNQYLTDETLKALATDFWRSLSALQNKVAVEIKQKSMITKTATASPRNYPICPKCGTVCYGDCED